MGRSEGQGVRRKGLIDVVRLLAAHHDMTTQAGEFMLAKGQVKLDGRTLGVDDRHLPVEALAGAVLCAGRRCARVLGSRPVQRVLGDGALAPSDAPRNLRLQSEDEQLSFI